MRPSSGETPVRLETPQQVRLEIERSRMQIARSLSELKEQVAQNVNWKEWVRRRPMLWLGGAFALGIYLGAHRRKRPHN